MRATTVSASTTRLRTCLGAGRNAFATGCNQARTA